MADSDTAVCNIALRKLREQPIQSLDADGSEPAKICNAFYADARDYMLVRHPHNFAMRRAILAQKSTGPAFEYDFAYSLPTSPYCLRAYQIYHGGTYHRDGWVVEGRELLTDRDNDLYLRYIARAEDTTAWNPAFTEVFTSFLAGVLAYPITRSTTAQDKWEARTKEQWSQYVLIDGGEGFDEEPELGVFTSIRA